MVKINGYRWDLYTDKRSWDRLGTDETLGRTFGWQYQIAIKPNQTHVQEEAATVLHEVLHAVWKHSFPDTDTERDQEAVIGGIELTLYAVLRDNPKLVAYLQDPEPLG